MNSGSSAIAILINSKTLSEKKLKLPLLASRCNFDNFLLYYRLFGTMSYFSFLEYAFFSNNIIPQKAILYPINLNVVHNCAVFVFNSTVGDTVICARTQKDYAGLFQLSAFAAIFPRSMRNFFANYFIFLACSLLLRRRPAVNFDKHSSPFHTDILNYCFLAPRQFSLFEFFFSRICDAPITQMVVAPRRLSDLAGAAFLNISKLFFQFSTISLHLNHIFFYCLFLQFAHKHFHFSLCFFRDKYFKFNSIPSLRSPVYTRSEHTILQFSRWMPLFREESLKFAFPGISQNFITFFFDKFFFFRGVCSHINYRPFPVLKFYFLNALPKTNSFQFLIFFLNTTSRNFFFDVKEYRELTNSNPILNFQKNYLSFYKKRIENRVSFLSILYHYSQIMDFQFKFNFAKVLNKNNDYIANLMEDRLEFSFKTLQFNVSEHLIPSKKKTQLTAIALKSDYFEIMDSLDEEFLVLNSLLLHLDLSKKNTLVAYLTSLIAKFKDLLILSYFFFSKMRYMNKQFDQIRVTCSLLSSFFKLFPNLFIFSFLEFSRGMFISSLISNLISFKTSLFGVSNFLLKLDFTNHFILFSSSSSNFFSNLSFFRLSVSGLINYYFFRSHTFFYTKFFAFESNPFSQIYLERFFSSKKLLHSLFKRKFSDLFLFFDSSHISDSWTLEENNATLTPILNTVLSKLDVKLKSSHLFFVFLHSWCYLGIARGYPLFQASKTFTTLKFSRITQRTVSFESLFLKAPYDVQVMPKISISSKFSFYHKIKKARRIFFFFYYRTFQKIMQSRFRILLFRRLNFRFKLRRVSLIRKNFRLLTNALQKISRENILYKFKLTRFAETFTFLQETTKFKLWRQNLNLRYQFNVNISFFGKIRSPVFCYFMSINTIHNFPMLFFSTFCSADFVLSSLNFLAISRINSVSCGNSFTRMDPRSMSFGASSYFSLRFSQAEQSYLDQNPILYQKFLRETSMSSSLNSWFPLYSASVDSFFVSFFSRGNSFHRNAATLLASALFSKTTAVSFLWHATAPRYIFIGKPGGFKSRSCFNERLSNFIFLGGFTF